MNVLLSRAQDLAQRIERAVLPPVCEPGAMPWLSLLYLAFPLLPALIPNMPRPHWGLTFAAIAAFLPLYFLFYWVRGWHRVFVLYAMAALGCALLPANFFANSFLIYSNVLAGFMGWRAMLAVLAGTQSMFAATVLALDPGSGGEMYIVMNLITSAVASFCNRFWILAARRNQALRLSQDEVQRLARVAERERIGRDLHDVLGHTLSVVALKSELAVRLFDRDPRAAQAEMREVERVAREALGQVRRAVSGMRALGLRAEFANARLALSAVEVDFEYRADELALDPEVETALALALREAATNVIRHARARRCSADLRVVGDDAVLSIVDDGLGGAQGEGNGLSGMRERVETLGGRVEIASNAGLGTAVSVRVPYRRQLASPDAPNAPVQPRLVAVK